MNSTKAVPRGQPVLTIQEGYGIGKDIPLERKRYIFGREEDCDIRLEDSNVSRHHASVQWDENLNCFLLEDLQSANGTFLNYIPVHEPVNLKHMDVIQMGGVMLVFNDPDNPSVRSDSSEEVQTNYDLTFLSNVVKLLEKNVSIVFKGKPEVVRNTILCLFSDGHLLLEDAPGVGKSVLAQTLAKSMQARYKRIQFTPDMLPSDITGLSIYDENARAFRFMPGPIFANVVLADEINRTTPRTQSSLLECMAESVVTIDGRGHVLPKPFFVIATENPEDYHGTYPLPEPQLDRFLMRLHIGYPDAEAEKEILDSRTERNPLNSISYVVRGADIVQCQALVRKVLVSEPVKDYIITLSNRTRTHQALFNGVSPRASLALMRAAQSLAAYSGRNYVIPSDVKELIRPVWSHRMRLKLRHQAEWKSVENVLDSIVEEVPVANEEPLP